MLAPITRLVLLCLSALAVGCVPDGAVSVTLTPTTPELAAVLVEADRRWEAAGVAPDRIVLGLHGAPVRVAALGSVDEGEVTGKTVGYRSEGEFGGVRRMDLASLDLANVMHELGHALGIGVGFVTHPFDHGTETVPECDLDAPSRPVMCEVGGDTITELDLTEACSVGACVGFAPEL
jgi:hypothetical protein